MFATEAKRQIVNEIHKPARINFKRRKVIVKSLLDLMQADLVDMREYEKENQGYKYILVVINCFSKYVWTFPLKSKTAKEVAENLENVFKIQTPMHLCTDSGGEFTGKEVQALMKKYNVAHYVVYSEKKASIVERVNRTLKGMMWKEFNMQGTYKWLDLIKNVVNAYNNRKHRTIGMKPAEVKKKHEKLLLKTVFNRIKMTTTPKYQVGDYVRISKFRGAFDKQYKPNWSTEIFTIKKVQLTNPVTYLLQDENNQDIKGGFYELQLQKVKYSDIYLVEKVLKRKGKKVFVKWLGFDNKHNSWIAKDNIA